MERRNWHRRAAVLGVLLAMASTVSAQNGMVRGKVTDVDGRAIKGATIRALNANGKPPEITAITDDKGRFAMLGMQGGPWRFVAEAPGFEGAQGAANIRSTAFGNPPIDFALRRSIEPLPNALSRQVAADIATADDLRRAGRLDQAVDAYEEILSKNPTLTMMNLVIGEIYRQRAGSEPNAAARQPLYDRAIASYQQLLKLDPDNARAKAELARTEQQKAGGN
jgi:tetratricopeptide (TPR) repeat protein